MERNDWVDVPVPVSPRASSARPFFVVPGKADPEANQVVRAPWPGRPIKEVLVVDPSRQLQRTLQHVLAPVASVHSCTTFDDAERRLRTHPPDLLITAVRLQANNGIHLAYLAQRSPRTRCIVYLTQKDFALAKDAEKAGAFVRPMTIAPARRKLPTCALSSATTKSFSFGTPPSVGKPA